jgi:murein DD-endopeptidase MepM/ murein hydrolase activator NlpD
VFWANNLKTTKLKAGWRLMIPPVDGLVVTVRPTDTLEALAAKHKVKAEAILAANKLSDPHLVMGQVLVVPGAKGAPLPKPKPKKTVTKAGSGAVASGGPSRYSGGRFVWPTGGGSISRGFRSGHQGLDIAADPGTTVKAAAGGKVLFAGWKSNGGGYQVWVSHGSGLYTTYNHMSSLSVGTGQSVGRGQRLGGVGSTGNSTGPHLHFEVWRGPIWNGGTRVNPMNYL